MPSFDVVSELDGHEVTNAIDQANRELTQRFDFKNVKATYTRDAKDEFTVLVKAEVVFQLKQMLDILTLRLSKRGIDPRCVDAQDPETNLAEARQKVVLKHGIEQETAKSLIKQIKDSTLKLGRRYGVALFIESLLLTLAVPFLNRHNNMGLYAAACACGLQNAMASTYSGTVVRTTHLSGMFTDLGISLGHFLRGIPVDKQRTKLSFLVISGFFSGGIGGCVAHHFIGVSALFIPAAFTAASSIAFGIYRMYFMR